MADWREDMYSADSRAAAPGGLRQQTTQRDPSIQQFNANGMPSSNWQADMFAADTRKGLPAWETGGQAGSIENGWNTPFYKKMFEQRDKHLDSGTLNAWYDDDDFTGVATWDYNGKRKVKFGDVYQDGQWVGNLLDPQSGYDEQSAYTMLASLTLDATEQRKAFEKLQVDPSAVKSAVEARRQETSKQIEGWQTQQEYAGKVEGLKEDWDDTASGWATFGAGFVGGAGIGAAGFAATPIVGAVTTLGGGIIGGVSAWWNRDEIIDQAARASVQTGMAGEEFGLGGGISTGLRQWGGVAQSAISPLTNIVHGATDSVAGVVGDDQGSYYTMEDRPAWLTALSLGATFGDALLQFAGPVGTSMYMSSMSATVLGGVGQLATQGGATFDDRRGSFDAPDDLGQWLAALGSVGIDAVQLGGAGAIVRSARNLAAPGSVGARTETIAGRTYKFDKDGNISGSRASLTLLAPSEAVAYASARVQAARNIARERGAVTVDDYQTALYKAATDLQSGSNLMKTVMVNAFGEGLEEGAQAILEPLSHGWTPELADIYEAYLQGAAAGAGMSAGARARFRAGNFELDKVNISMRTQGLPEYTEEEWSGMSKAQRSLAKATPKIIEDGLKQVAQRTAEEMLTDRVRFVAGAERLDDAVRLEMAAEMRTLNPPLQGTYSLTQVDSARIPNHVVQASMNTVIELLQTNLKGLEEQLNTVAPELRAGIEGVIAESKQILAQVLAGGQAFSSAETAEQRAVIVAEVNRLLQDAWNSASAESNLRAKAVTLMFDRNPVNSGGSFQALLPQVSQVASEKNGDGVLQVSQAILKALDGDWDGDKLNVTPRLVLEDDVFRTTRLGLHFLGSPDGPNIGVRTYEAEQLRQVAISLEYSDNQKENAEALVEDIRMWLESALSSVANISEYADFFAAEVRKGNTEAKSALLKRLATERADDMTALGENGNAVLPPMNNTYLAIDQAINERLQMFKEQAAAREDVTPNLERVQPVLPGSSLAAVVAQQAATIGVTMQQATAGADPFRSFQKLHYSGYRSPAVAATEAERSELRTLAEFYEQLSGGMQQSVIEDMFAKDEISKRATRMMIAVAQQLLPGMPRMQAVAVLAGMEVPDVTRDEKGGFTSSGGTISFAQFTLRESATQLRNRDAVLLESNPDLEKKYQLFMNMGPGEAIAEMLDPFPMIALLGEAANNFGAHLTFGQVKASYVNRNAAAREDFAILARQDVRYDKSVRHDLPYSEAEVNGGKVSGYQVIVDALFEAGNSEISFDRTTSKLHGRLAQREADVQEKLEKALTGIRGGLRNLAELYKMPLNKDGRPDAQALAEVLDRNPDIARPLLAAIPGDIAHVVIESHEDGTVSIPRWFFQMLLDSDAKSAAMTYFRHTLIAKVNAHQAQQNPHESDDRLVALIERLREEPDRLLEFERLLYTSKDVTKFIEAVNREFLRNEAPFLAWFRDAAQFDPTRSKGGWSQALPGTKLRESLSKFETAAVRFNDFAEQEMDQDKTDRDMVRSLKEALDQRNQGRDSDTMPLLARLEKRLTDAGNLLAGMGPASMKLAPLAAALGFFGGATDKGKAADVFAQLGHDAARGDNRLWANGAEQMSDALTSADAQDVARNAQVLARDDHRMMDEQGRVINWQKLDAARFLELWDDPANRPMLRAILFPSAWEQLSNGSLEQQMLVGTSLVDLVEDRTYRNALSGKSHVHKMQYASVVNALVKKFGGDNDIQRLVADLVVAWTNGADHTLEIEEIAALQDEAYSIIVDVLRTAADANSDLLLESTLEALNNLTSLSKMGQGDPALLNELRKSLVADLDPVNLPETATAEERADAERRHNAMRGFLESDAFEETSRLYSIDWANPADVVTKQEVLYATLLDNPSIKGPNAELLRSTIRTNARGTLPVVSVNETESREIWDGFSREVIATVVDDATSVAMMGSPAFPIPAIDGKNASRLKYWNQSYKYLVQDILDPQSPLMRAAKEFRTIVLGEDASQSTTPADLVESIGKVLDPQRLGPWTSDIARQSVDAQNRIDSSGAGQQVARAGIAYARQAALAAATRRTDKDPGEGAARAYRLADDTVRKILNLEVDIFAEDGLMAEGREPEPLAILNGRFLTGATISFRVNGEMQTVDLFSAKIRPGQTFQANGVARNSPYLVTSVNSLRRSLETAIPDKASDLSVDLSFFHPADLPADPDFANNLFFEGSAFDDAGDTFDSLIRALWFSSRGLNVTEQLAALKANKNGTQALRQPKLPSYADVQEMEDVGNFYGMLRAKTLAFMKADLGHGQVDSGFYSAVFKDLKMRHGVRTIVDGRVVLYSADEVIAMQREGTQIPGTDIEIVALSPRVLNTMLGDQGGAGLIRPLQDVPSLDSSGVRTYNGTWQELADVVPGLTEIDPATNFYRQGRVEDTPIAHRTQGQQLTVKPSVPRAMLQAYQRRMETWIERRNLAEYSRSKDPKRYKNQRKEALALINGDIKLFSKMPQFALRDLGFPVDLPLGLNRHSQESLARYAFKKLQETLAFNDRATAWVYSDDGSTVGTKGNGILHGLSTLDAGAHDAHGENVVHGDVVVVRLESFDRPGRDYADKLREVTKVVHRLAGLGATVALTDGNGSRELRGDASRVLESLNYDRVAGAPGMYRPQDPGKQFKTREARFSRLAEMRPLSSNSNVVVFQALGVAIEENAAIVNNVDRKQGREVVFARDLTPTTAYPGFNIARTDEQRALVRRTLDALTMHNSSLLEHAASLSKTTVEELRPFVEHAAANLDENTGLPAVDTEFGPGDILVLVGPRGQVILYRHGFEPLRSGAELDEQLQTPAGDDTMPGNLAVYGSEQMADATTHRGMIQEWDLLSGYGLSLIERIPLGALGNKTVLERNGMKLVGLAIDGTGLQLPDFGPLERWEIDYIISRADSVSKENYDGVIDNARNAFGYLGMDFVPALAQSFFGVTRTQWNGMKPTEKNDLRLKVRAALDEIRVQEERLSVETVNSLQRLIGSGSPTLAQAFATVTSSATIAALDVATDWAKKSSSELTAEDQITMAAVLYMLSPQAKPEHIMSAAGFDANVPAGEAQSHLMPELFTGVFDRAPMDSSLRKYIFNEINLRLANRETSGRQQGYVMQQDWKVVIRNADGSKDLEGFLQFAEAHTTGDNPALAEFARERRDSSGASRQKILMTEHGLGAATSQPEKLKKTSRMIRREGITPVNTADDLFTLMNGGKVRKVGPSIQRTLLPAQQMALDVGKVAMRAFRQPIDTTVWDDPGAVAKFTEIRERIVLKLGLTEQHAGHVDGWIRQWLGAPKDANPETEAGHGRISFSEAEAALREIEANVDRGLYPVWGAAIPVLHLHDVDLLWKAFSTSGGLGWQLKKNGNEMATEWKDFVHVALGMRDTAFDPAWLTAADGFMHTFRDAGEGLAGLPISLDEIKDMKLLDPTTNQMVLSFNPDYHELLRTPQLESLYQANFEEIFQGTMQEGRYFGRYPSSSKIAKSQKKMARWREKNEAGTPTTTTLGDIAARGSRFVTHGTTTNALSRILTNLRAANGMLNPWLYAVAPLEMGVRGVLEDASSLLMGESTGVAGQLAGKVGASRYDVNTLEHARLTYNALGRNQKFMGMMYNELVTIPKLHNAGRVEKFTAEMARVGGRWQDPAYGQFGHSIARRYAEAAMRHVADQGSNTTLTPKAIVTMLDRDPEALQKNYPEIHMAAVNVVANVRSLKPTVASLLFKGIVDPLTSNPRFLVNFSSTLALKIPFLFLPYAFNVATNMLGLQGLNAMAAVLLGGKEGGKKFGRLQAFLQGVEYDENIHGIDFMAETLEAVDLSGAFVRAGMTHTALMGLGLMAGNLGLSGEDEEDRRRRREAALQGAGHVYDPRQIMNDFRNADAIYLDNLPEWLPFAQNLKEMYEVTGPEAPGGAVSMAQMHWTLKQFISPLMGIEKFLNTGNYMHVVWGFEDALGSMPLVNAGLWDEANQINAQLQTAAAEAEASGTPESMGEQFSALLNGVMKYERMLFENSFVNSIYTASDKYDRDPWKMPEVDKGGVARDNLNQPMPTDALQQYLTEDGTVAEGYVGRDWWGGQLHTLSENRMTLALFGSLFTGLGESSLWRENMVVKVREVEKNALSREDASALVLSLWDPENEREVLTRDGGEAVLRGLRMGTIKPGDPALENTYLTYEMREELQEILMDEIMQEAVDLGLSQEQAEHHLNEVWYGSSTNPFATPLKDVVWSQGDFEGSISYSPTNRYNQLNTTYVMGPDGKPWATGIGRDKLNNFWGQVPLARYNAGDVGNLGVDGRLNSVDETSNINTGMRNLEKIDDTWANPTDEDILAAIDKGFKKVVDATRFPRWSNNGGRGGGGGGGGYSYRLNSPVRNDPTNGRNVPYVNVDNPIIRRATIRRERFSSSRGRLNQWQ